MNKAWLVIDLGVPNPRGVGWVEVRDLCWPIKFTGFVHVMLKCERAENNYWPEGGSLNHYMLKHQQFPLLELRMRDQPRKNRPRPEVRGQGCPHIYIYAKIYQMHTVSGSKKCMSQIWI